MPPDLSGARIGVQAAGSISFSAVVYEALGCPARLIVDPHRDGSGGGDPRGWVSATTPPNACPEMYMMPMMVI